MDGWIKLYRKLLNSPIFENEKALKIWIWCMLKATHTEKNQLVGQQIVSLQEGQFIFGREKASEELKMTESTVYKYIKLLEKLEMISINSNNKFSVVSIENWDRYQDEKQQKNNKVTTKEQQSNTNKNVKNVNNIYLYFINKYKAECSKRLNDKMKFLREIQNEDKYKELTPDEEYDLRDYILKDVR